MKRIIVAILAALLLAPTVLAAGQDTFAELYAKSR